MREQQSFEASGVDSDTHSCGSRPQPNTTRRSPGKTRWSGRLPSRQPIRSRCNSGLASLIPQHQVATPGATITGEGSPDLAVEPSRPRELLPPQERSNG